jgi:hypothetical protein
VVEIGITGVGLFARRCRHSLVASPPAATAATAAPPAAPARTAFTGLFVAATFAARLIALARFACRGVSAGGSFAPVRSLRTRGPFGTLRSFDTARFFIEAELPTFRHGGPFDRP